MMMVMTDVTTGVKVVPVAGGISVISVFNLWKCLDSNLNPFFSTDKILNLLSNSINI